MAEPEFSFDPLLSAFPSPHHHQTAADYNQNDSNIPRQKIAVVGVDADVDIAGVDAVTLRVRYGYEEGKDSEHQDNESNGKEFQENPPILLADFRADAPSGSELALPNGFHLGTQPT